jgi:Predicted metal-dependent membrane protease
MPVPPRPDLESGTSLVPSLAPPLGGGRPKSTWRWWDAIGVVFGALILGSIASIPVFAVLHDTRSNGASGVSELAQGIVTDAVGLVVVILWLIRWHPEWRQAIGFPPRGRRLREALTGAALGLAVLVAATVASTVILTILQAATGGAKQSLPEQVRSDLSHGAVVLFAILALVVAPITEEFVFRGLIFRTIRDRHGFLFAAVVSALLFGLVHFVAVNDWQSTLALQATMVITGLGLATIYEKRGNLVASIAAHSAFNAVAVFTIALHALR